MTPEKREELRLLVKDLMQGEMHLLEQFFTKRVMLMLDAVDEIRRDEPTPRKPDGYAYMYSSGIGGHFTRFNDGVTVNGKEPIAAIPYWLEYPPLQPNARNQATELFGGNTRNET